MLISLNRDTNYIVSGLERSGTSMMMQILDAGDIPISYDDSRGPDEHNPKGYYELEGGKIISRLKDGSFPIKSYRGSFIKVTAYGLRYLPSLKYKIIYMERNIDEVIDSMDKMGGKWINTNRESTKEIYIKLNKSVRDDLKNRGDMDVLTMNYNDLLKNPSNLNRINTFLGVKADISKMSKVIDDTLYRQRYKEST